MITKPPFRKLRGYAFDPSLSLKVDTAFINRLIYKIPWEDKLQPGPSGEYIEVMDYDPTVNKWYQPVDLNDEYILAQDGLDPSGSNPQFHQQMVYSVCMTTIRNFELALGRPILWRPHLTGPPEVEEVFTHRLRIYPHAFRDSNAYYSPQKKAILFGYFSARPAHLGIQMPNNLTFTCLSHDIIAHETTHAILDGLYPKFTDDTNLDILAFHEAFSDIVALFQHFTFPEVLKNQIAATRGDLAAQNLLGKLAQEFGTAIGSYGALRDAIGYIDPETKTWKPKVPDPDEYARTTKPHARGSILVSAVFDAFLTIYKLRVAELLRIATGGTGILPQGELHPDLVNRLADEAAKSASHVLRMCIRALDYCPPVDITFGDYLRAIITADLDLVADDNLDYRIAFIDAFRKRGIYPTGIKNLSVESLRYEKPDTGDLDELFEKITEFCQEFRGEIIYTTSRKEIFETTKRYIAGRYGEQENLLGIHRRLNLKFSESPTFERLTGLVFSQDHQRLGVKTSKAYNTQTASFSVHSLHLASRVGPDGTQSNQIILTLVQRAKIDIVKNANGKLEIKGNARGGKMLLAGGCTLIFDLDRLTLKYAIPKPILDVEALQGGTRRINEGRPLALYKHQGGKQAVQGAYQAYFGAPQRGDTGEPFAFLHTD